MAEASQDRPIPLVAEGPVLLELHADGVAHLRLNRPETSNGLNLDLLKALHDVLMRLHGDSRVRVVLLTGEGKNFCAGGDVHIFLDQGEALPAYIRVATAYLSAAAGALIRLNAPVVAAVQGFAAGGGGMGLVCSSDLVIAGQSTRFLAGATRVAMVPDAGVSVTLTQLVGFRKAMEILLLNPVITATEALDMGLVTAVAAGTANIIETSETKTGSAAVTVTDPVTSVTVSPTAPSVTVGQTQQMTATTSDINGQPLSGRTVAWASDNSAVASVDPSTGVVTAVAAGTANITATSEGVTSSPAVVTVTNVPVATVDVTPANPSLSAAISETVSLTATPKDGSGNTLSMSGRTLTWSSDTPSVATVDPSTGVVTALTQGTATITATVDGVPGSTIVTVNP